jgi:monovalent cation:H+ antiporter-2, CPA2 family
MNNLLGIIEIFYICLGGLFGFIFYKRYQLGVGIYVIIGIILGPDMLNCVSISYLSQTFSSLGILFVLFEIGLHLSYEKILVLKQYLLSSSFSIFFSVISVLITFFLYTIFTPIANIYILISMLLCISSTPLVFNLLQEKNKLYTKTGRFVFTTMLLQDILSIFLLINNTNNENIFLTLSKTIIILFFLFLIGKKVINKIFKKFSYSLDFILLISFLIIIGLSLLTEYAGLSLELGAVLAGFLLAETDYSTYIESQILPMKKVLLCVFFMTTGMYFPLKFLYANLATSMILFISIMIFKFIGLFLGARLFLLNTLQSITAALMLLSVGEVIFIFINKIFQEYTHIIPRAILNYLCIITVLSLVITPIFFHLFYFFYHKKMEQTSFNQERFILLGFNNVTEIIIQIFEKYQINYLCLEKNINIVNKNQNYNLTVYNDVDIQNIKNLSRIFQNTNGIFFYSPPNALLLTEIKSYNNFNIYIRVQNSEEQRFYENLGFRTIHIDIYNEVINICNIILKDKDINLDEVEKTFFNNFAL